MKSWFFQHKQTWQHLKQKPNFVAAIVLTLGLTLGTLLCVITLTYVVIFSALPYPKAADLYRLDSVFSKGQENPIGNFFTYPGAIELHKNQQLFSQTALVIYSESKVDSEPLQPNLLTTYTTPEWFSLLGAKVLMGRVFAPSEAIDSNNPVAVLSYTTWRTVFSGDANILDKSISIAGKSFRVIGVLAQTFVEPRLRDDGSKTALFLPWDFNPIKAEREQAWGQPHPDIAMFGNLNSAQNSVQAEQNLSAQVNNQWQDKVAGIAFWHDYHIDLKLRSFKTVILGDIEKTVYLLLIAVIGLVLIALANVANLWVARMAEQQRKLAIQAALGATPKHIFSLMLAETSQLMCASILFALVIASAGFVLLRHYFSLSLPRVEELSMNTVTVAAAVIIASGLAILFAVLASRMLNYKTLQSSLQSSGKGAGIQVSTAVRNMLIVCQVAIASLIMFISVNVFNAAYQVIKQPLGIATDNRYLIELSSWAESAPAISASVNDIAQKLQALPQVDAVSQAFSPLGLFDYLAHKPVGSDSEVLLQTLPIDENYFALVEQPLLAGRNFTASDINDSNNVIIVDENYARTLALNGSAVGLQVQLNANAIPATVIGVVKALKLPNENSVPMRTYYPFPTDKFRLKLLVKVKQGQALSSLQIVKLVKEVNGQVGFYQLSSLAERRNELLFTQFTTTLTSACLVLISYLLAAIGIYGVLHYSVQLRQFELGIRMALGARPNTIFLQILKDNLIPVMLGLGIAMAAMLGLWFWLQSTSFNLQTSAFGWLLPMLLIVALTAATSLLSVWHIIRKPASFALRGN